MSMTPERWRAIEELYEAAHQRPPADRPAWLMANATNPAVRQEVESLLACAADGTGVATFRETIGAVSADALRTGTLGPGARVGAYRLIRLLGEGGMGTVYLAQRDDEQFQKQVAVKVIRRGMDTPSAIERFRRERQILAHLEHPHVARLLDGGATDDGRPFLVMEFVDGLPLLAWCELRPASIAERLRLFRQVCAAVQYAHQNLVIHRDLKTANILVAADGTPRLLDFGIARLIDPSGAADRAMTAALAMTPAYASPEQIRGDVVTTATDVYSLGVILFELLTGRLPYHVPEGAGAYAVEQAVSETAPPRPSAVAPAERARLLRGDLDAIVATAMRKEPARRYPSVTALAEDVRRALDGRPVSARRDTAAYRAATFVRRNKALVAAVLLAMVALSGGLAVSIRQTRLANERFHDVRELANKFLFDFDAEIRQVPGTTKARQLIVDTALDYLSRLERGAQDDEGVRYEVARAYQKVADVQGMPGQPNLGNPEAGIASYDKSVAMLGMLHRGHPGDDVYRRPLSEYLMRRGYLLSWTRGPAAGLASIRQGLALVKRDGASPHPDDLRLATIGENYLCQYILAAGDPATALEHGRLALDYAARYLALRPAEMRMRSMQQIAASNASDAAVAGGDLQGGLTIGQGIVARRRAMRAENPSYLENLRELATTLYKTGELQFRVDGPHLGDRAGAIASLGEAVQISEQLLAADPRNNSAIQDLAATLTKYGNVFRDTDPARAKACYDRVLAHVATFPESFPRRRSFHANTLGYRSVAQQRLGRTSEAIDDVSTYVAYHRDNYAASKRDSARADLALAEYVAGRVLLEAGRRDEAKPHFERSMALVAPDEPSARTNIDIAYRLSAAWEGLAAVLPPADAARWRQKRIDLWTAWTTGAHSNPYATAELRRALITRSVDADVTPGATR